MKKLVFALLALMVTCLGLATAPAPAFADEPAAAAAAAPDPAAMEKRIADLEAYVNNSARADDKASKVMAPGPGHNGFMMVCAALVLFMTLPGLALFYGGVVRSKNVVLIMAQYVGFEGWVGVVWGALGSRVSLVAVD